MDKQKELRKLKNIIKKIVEEYSPEKIILFGSWVWGNPTQDSDFDLLIVKKDKKSFLLEQQKVRRIINGEIAADILVRTPREIKTRLNLGDFFFEDIIKKGTSIYEKSKQ